MTLNVSYTRTSPISLDSLPMEKRKLILQNIEIGDLIVDDCSLHKDSNPYDNEVNLIK